MSMRTICKKINSNPVKVSVIMPVCHEPPEYLLSAVQSIVSQRDFVDEFIICDDGVSADTRRVLEKLESSGEIKLVVNNGTKGASGARNRAIACASGQYIALMDADDISGINRIQKEYEFLEKNNQYSFVGGKGEFFEKEPRDRQKNYWFVEYPEPEDFLMTLPFVHASLMFRWEVLEAVGGYREITRVKRSEDYDLLLRLYEAGYRGANLPETLYYIRQDRAVIKRRKYRYRFFETAVKGEGFFRLGLMPKGVFYAMKPLVVGLLPGRLLTKLKQNYYGKKNERNL